MARNTKDVELRIRARDETQKTMKNLVSTIDKLSKAQDEQRKSAERGETSAKELEAGYRKLESAGQALLKLNSLVEMYKRQSAALTDQQAKLDLAREKQRKLAETYANTENVSAKLESQMGRANKALESQSKQFDNAKNRVARTAAELQRFGVSTANIGSAQAKIITSVGRLNSALERQQRIIEQAPAAAARYKAAQEAQAKAEAQAAAQAASAAAMAKQRIEEQAYAQNKIIDSLRRQAEQALAAAKGYQTLGRVVASTKLKGNSSLAGDIQSIVSPATAARSTLSGLERQVSTLNTALVNGTADMKKAASSLKELQAAQTAAVSIAKLIDQFRNQVTAVRNARNEYRAAKTEVLDLAAQMRTATSDTGNLGAKMQQAQQRLSAASSALHSTGTAARSAQAALRAAGVDTRNLSSESARLQSTARQAKSGVDQLTEALKKNSEEAGAASKALEFFDKQGQQSVSTFQSLKSSILGLVTTYASLQAGINLASGAIDAYKLRQQTMIKMGTVVGSSQSAQAAEWKYMIDLSDRLGIKLSDVAVGYSKFAVAAKNTGLSLQQSKFVFESIAKTSRVFHLSADEMSGIFTAMQQMLSKGQVYAEELNGQLGERLPTALAMFAKGMDMTTGELLKAMQKGEISGDAVINFARAQAKEIDAELATAEKGVDAMEARAANASTAFKLALADSGFIEAYTRLLQRLTEYLNSGDGKEAAKQLGEAFSKVADGLIWCIDNVDSLVTALEVLAGLKVIGVMVTLGKSLIAVGEALGSVGRLGDWLMAKLTGWAAQLAAGAGATRLLGTALGVLARSIPYVGWALLAYDIGAILYEQSQTFAKACDEVARDFKNLGNQLVALIETPTAAMQDMTYAILRPITTLMADSLRKIAKWIADVLALIPGVGDSMSKWVMDVADNLTKENRDMFQNVSQIWDDVNKKWVAMNNEIVKKYDDSMTEVVKKTLAAKAQILQADIAAVTGFQYTADPGGGPTKRDREIKALKGQFDALTKSAEKAELAGKKALQRKNLPGRLALVDEEYAPQMQRAKAVGGDEGAKLVSQLQKVIDMRKKAETDEFNSSQRSTTGVNKRQKAIESLTNKYKELQASIQLKTEEQDPNATLETRTAAAVVKMQQQYAGLKEKAVKIGGKEGAQLTAQLNTLEAANQKYITQKMQLEEIARLQQKLTDLQNARKNKIETINNEKKAGVINEDTQVQKTVAVNQSMNPQIEQAANALSVQADASRSLFSDEAWSGLQSNISNAKASLSDLTGTYTTFDSTIVSAVLDGMNTAISSLVTNMSAVVAGTQSLGEAFQAVGVSMLQFFSQLLQQIAMAIIKQMILNALSNSSYGGIANAAVSAGGAAAGAMHNGGIVGDKSSGGQQQRGMNPAWFAGAKRYHDGGLPGLKSDEVPTILQKGEQVLDKNDPNNILNQTGSGNNSQDPSSTRFVLVDDRAKIPEAMNAPEGENVVLQILRRNAPSVRAIVKNRGKTGR